MNSDEKIIIEREIKPPGDRKVNGFIGNNLVFSAGETKQGRWVVAESSTVSGKPEDWLLMAECIKKVTKIVQEIQIQDGIVDLIDNIIHEPLNVNDNPNGGYEWTCPHCLAMKELKRDETIAISELEHNEDCTYLKALSLKKRLEKNYEI